MFEIGLEESSFLAAINQLHQIVVAQQLRASPRFHCDDLQFQPGAVAHPVCAALGFQSFQL
jgi:hypothetical protein